MSISAGVVRAIALQQIDHAPHAKASAEGNHKGLQSGDGRSEKLHIFLRFSGDKAPAMKKAALAGGACRTLGQFVPKCCLYKGVRVIEIVIVEDVLVLVCERLVRHGRLVHL